MYLKEPSFVKQIAAEILINLFFFSPKTCMFSVFLLKRALERTC